MLVGTDVRVTTGSFMWQVQVMLGFMPTRYPTEMLKSLIDTSPHGIVILDQEDVVKCWSPMAETIFEVAPCDAIDVNVNDLLNVDSDREDQEDPVRFAEIQVSQKSRAEIQIEQTAHRVTINDQNWTIVYINDVTFRREQEKRLASEALTDPLSELSNRRGFQEQLEYALSGKLTLSIIDIDNFKQVNDRFGHEAGDLAIKHIATQLLDCFPDAVTCSRLGGDEFGVVLKTGSAMEMEEKFERLRQRIAALQPSKYDFSLTASIGIALSNVAGTSARELLTTADRCMYQAKKAGRNQIVLQPINV